MTERATRPDPSLQLLGATIREYRKQRRFAQKMLAARTGIPHTYISEIELGQRNILVLMLLRLAHALDLPAAFLLARLDTHASLAPPTPSAPLTSSEMRDMVVTPHVSPLLKPGDPDRFLRLLGITLHQYRQQRRLSQRALAARTGLNKSYIGQIEQGQRNVSVLSLLRIADALGLSVAHLLAPLDALQHPSTPSTE